MLNGMMLEQYEDVSANCGIMRSRAYYDRLVLNKDSAILLTGLAA
jgi:hypothetical protein